MELTDDLKSYWKLNETSGTRYDSVANNCDLTDNNTVTYEAGLIGNAAKFIAENSESLNNVTGGFKPEFDDACSISLWVKLTSEISTGIYDLVDVSGYNGSAFGEIGIRYQYNSGNRRLMFFRYHNEPIVSNPKYYNISLGTDNWYHLVFVYNGLDTLEGFVNGSSIGTVASADSDVNYSLRFGLGALAGGTGNFANALIDEVGVWSRVLTSDEIAELYNSGSGLTYPFTTPDSRSSIINKFRRHR